MATIFYFASFIMLGNEDQSQVRQILANFVDQAHPAKKRFDREAMRLVVSIPFKPSNETMDCVLKFFTSDAGGWKNVIHRAEKMGNELVFMAA